MIVGGCCSTANVMVFMLSALKLLVSGGWKGNHSEVVCCRTSASFHTEDLSMKKSIVVGLAILAVSTSAALAAHKTHHATKPKASAAATNPSGPSPLMMGQVSAADLALYKKNKHDSGMK